MSFENTFNLKQAILKEMEYNLWFEETDRPGILGTKEEWEKYFKYEYYRRFKLNTIDEGTVALTTNTIINFMNETFDRIATLTNTAFNITKWEDKEDIYPALELISIPIISENGRINPGKKMSLELSPNDYPLYFGNVENTLKYINELSKNTSYINQLQLDKLGVNNTGLREITPNLNFLAESNISRDNIPLVPPKDGTKLDTFLKIINPLKMVSLNPADSIIGRQLEENKNYIYKGKNPPRTQVFNRDVLYYRKFSYTNDNGELLGYRYIPLLPNLLYSDTNNISKSTVGSGDYTYGHKSFFNFGFQPFNDFEIFETAESGATRYLSSLPSIMYSSSGSLNPYLVYIFPAAAIPYGYRQVWVDVNEISQYLYLCEIKFAIDEESIENIEYNKLNIGTPPIVDSGGGEGETAGESGTVGGGNKQDIEAPGVAGGGGAAPGTVIKTYPIIDEYLEPGFYGGIYIPTYRYIMELKEDVLGYSKNDEAVNKLNQIIRNLTALGKGNALVEVFMTYSGFINGIGIEKEGGPVVDNRYKLPAISINIERPVYLCGFNSNNGYLPKNKKLLSYPYLSFEINGYGEINELKPENWSGEKPTINVCSKFLPGSPIFVFPSKYNGVQYNYDAGVAGQPLPVLPYTIDSYKNEYNACVNSRTAAITSLTETSISNGIYSVLGGAAGATGAGAQWSREGHVNLGRGDVPFYDKTSVSPNGMTGINANKIINGAQGLTNALMNYHQGLREFEAQLKDVENRPLAIANQNASPSLPYLNSNAGAPFIVWKSIRREFAEKIDEFFTRYGYKVNKFKEVDIHTRPVFNFLKCSQARVEGSIPNEDLMQIKTILEKGITFWHDPSKILNYNVENPAPITNKPNYYNGYYSK